MLVASGFVSDSDEDASHHVLVRVVVLLVGGDKGRVAVERSPRLAYRHEAHQGLGW